MAASAFLFYNQGRAVVLGINLVSEDLAAVLLDTAHALDLTDANYSDISGDEISDGDYAVQLLGTKVINAASSPPNFDCADISFGSSVTIAARILAIVHRAGGSLVSGDDLIGFIDLNPLLVTVDDTTGFELGETLSNDTAANTVGRISAIISGTVLAVSLVENAPANTNTVSGDESGATATVSGTPTGNDGNVSSSASTFQITINAGGLFNMPLPT